MQSRHNTFAFTLAEGTIRVDSDFDSGNLDQAALLNNKLTLTPAFDPMNSQYSTKQSSKTFFHFRIVSDKALTLAIVIKNMKILEYFSSVFFLPFRMNNLTSYIESVSVEEKERASQLLKST